MLIPVINTTDEQVSLKKGCTLGEITDIENTEGLMWAEPEQNNPDDSKVSHLYNLGHIKQGRVEIENILNKYHSVTSRGDYDVGECKLDPMHIDTGNRGPVYVPPRRMSPIVRQELSQHIDEWQKNRIITTSNSSWSFPLVAVRKKDGTCRPCADLREINKITRYEAHPLPNLDDSLKSLKGSRFFTSLDLNKGFMQMFLDEESSNKCSFPFAGTLYRFLRVPFGLKSAPGWFQLQMNTVLAGFTPEQLLVYLDDFLLHTPDLESHLILLDKVLARLQSYGLKIRPSKCEILKTEVEYLGHRISEEGISPLAASVDKIKNYPRPGTCKQVRRLVGLANWYREYVRDFSTLIRPLTQCMSKSSFKWTDQCEDAFQKVKNLFSSEDVLAYPDYQSENPLILTCDASASGVGGYLSQYQNNRERIISYYLKCFNEAHVITVLLIKN